MLNSRGAVAKCRPREAFAGACWCSGSGGSQFPVPVPGPRSRGSRNSRCVRLRDVAVSHTRVQVQVAGRSQQSRSRTMESGSGAETDADRMQNAGRDGRDLQKIEKDARMHKREGRKQKGRAKAKAGPKAEGGRGQEQQAGTDGCLVGRNVELSFFPSFLVEKLVAAQPSCSSSSSSSSHACSAQHASESAVRAPRDRTSQDRQRESHLLGLGGWPREGGLRGFRV